MSASVCWYSETKEAFPSCVASWGERDRSVWRRSARISACGMKENSQHSQNSQNNHRKDISSHILQSVRDGFLTLLPHSVDDRLLLCVGESGIGFQLLEGFWERLQLSGETKKYQEHSLFHLVGRLVGLRFIPFLEQPNEQTYLLRRLSAMILASLSASSTGFISGVEETTSP